MRTNRNPRSTATTHELRTPLNAIIGYTGTLLMGLPGPLNAEQEKQLLIIQESARKLLSLINGMDAADTVETARALQSADVAAGQFLHSGEKATQARVLVIEDDEASRKLIVYLLKAAGYEALVAQDGEQGLAMARSHVPDLILCDVEMPRMSGEQLGAALKGDALLSGIPLIAVSALAQSGEESKTRRAGFDHWIRKPIDPRTFAKQLKPFIAHRETSHL